MKNAKVISFLSAILFTSFSSGNFASESDPKALLSSLDRKFIPVYKTVVPKEGTFNLDYQEEVARLSNLTLVKLLKSANFGFEGDPVAYEIETENKITGWVSLDQVWFPAKVVRIKEGDRLNVRAGESLDSKIVDSVRPDEILYVNANVLIHLGYKGYDPVDWARVSTKRGNHGFVRLRYFEIIETKVKPYP
ncbi:SH3 domain-containing protein [Leptospira sp. 201903071]|uniref:SH3 domain-containing protein n=1 Tax=Leptospira ainazelensis TaxID=2810034 RepID=UPI001966A620|nr:SH3 domain-containing protein [Leptospira ainazelensis]MBM9502535.1 SH3 domain-containing protein [Leptospira ainazelensis]